jgi:GT2 family glycosyltransferase
MKILHVIFSCNRLQYLTKTLDSLENLDYGSHEVTRLIVDDYPRTRNDSIFQLLAKTHKTLLWMNTENKGLSVTWSDFFEWLKTQDYDYILHQEDDVILKRRIRIDDMIECLESSPKIASVVLQRQPWYFHEQESKIEEGDLPFGNYWYSKNTKTFPIIFSLYKKSIVEYPFRQLKGANGENLIEHIGEESTGKRILQGEPNWEKFAHMDPNLVYSSRDGKLIEN